MERREKVAQQQQVGRHKHELHPRVLLLLLTAAPAHASIMALSSSCCVYVATSAANQHRWPRLHVVPSTRHPQKESKARAAERAAAAKQAVVAAEAERHTLFLLRANLEMTRWVVRAACLMLVIAAAAVADDDSCQMSVLSRSVCQPPPRGVLLWLSASYPTSRCRHRLAIMQP